MCEGWLRRHALTFLDAKRWKVREHPRGEAPPELRPLSDPGLEAMPSICEHIFLHVFVETDDIRGEIWLKTTSLFCTELPN